jgi:hypothetical protein
MFSSRTFSFVLLACALFSCKQKTPPPKTAATVAPVITSREEKERLYDLDKSPMDMIYYPEDFPVLKMSGKVTGLPVARVIYSRPSKDGRTIFGNVVKYGTYWRLGANEGTEIEFFTDVVINGRRVKKGRYIIYCIPYEKKWTIRLNDDLYAWGLRIHSNRDVYSFDIPVEKLNQSIEILTMKFMQSANGAEFVMGWDSAKASLPFKY